MVEVIRSFRPTVVINGWAAFIVVTDIIKPPDFSHRKPCSLPLIPITNSAFSSSEQQGAAIGAIAAPILLLDVDRGEKPQGYPLPLDDVSTLYGNLGARLVLDAFAQSPYAGHHRF